MLQPDLRRTGIQLQIRLAEKAPLYRYSLVPGKVVILSGSVGRKNQLIEMVVNSVADIEAGQSSSSSAASKQAAVKLFSADDLLQFTGPAGRAAVEGDIVGEMVDLECDSGETFSLAIYIEDASGFTALTVHLQGLGDVLKSSMTVGSRARIVGTLQILDGELVLVAQAKEVSLNGEYGLSDAPSNMVVTQVPQYQAEDVLRMREDSVLCKVRCVVVKPFDVDGQGAVGVVMMLGKRNVALKVQLTFDGVEDVAEKLLRRAKVELEGTLLRDEALKFTMVTTDASKVTVLEDINASFAGSSPYTPTSSTPFDFGNASKSSSSSALRTIDNTPTFLKVKVEPEDAYELYGGGSELQNSTPKIPNGKRRQQLRDRYKCSEGVPKKKIVLYDLTDDEAVEGANSSESEDIEGENQ
ncbi:hypothetical protein AAVH_26412 [Aphelenchoides avenae]|nr:hypothetical protein AAVH_26412 [Aphelenchus avenae]